MCKFPAPATVFSVPIAVGQPVVLRSVDRSGCPVEPFGGIGPSMVGTRIASTITESTAHTFLVVSYGSLFRVRWESGKVSSEWHTDIDPYYGHV